VPIEINFSIKDLVRLRQPAELQPGVQVSKAGGFVRARYVGQKDSVLGPDVATALQRLSRLHLTGSRTPNYRIKERVQ
jgi:hypothetical protein